MPRTTSTNGVDFVKREEGKKNLAYPDPVSRLYRYCVLNGIDPYFLTSLPVGMTVGDGRPWTIGVGHTGGDVTLGTWWDEAKIDATLKSDLAQWEDYINEEMAEIDVELSQNQFDALISFTHNLGRVLAQSTMFRYLKAGNFQAAADEFPKWDMAGGSHNPSLHARRLRERALFLTPDQETK